MSEIPVFGVPIMMQTRLAGDDVLRLTAERVSVKDKLIALDNLFTVNGVSSPDTDVYISVESRNLERMVKVFMPGRLDVVWDPEQRLPSVDELHDTYSATVGFLGFRSSLQDAPFVFLDLVPKAAPEKLRNSGSALLSFTNIISYYIRSLEQPFVIDATTQQ